MYTVSNKLHRFELAGRIYSNFFSSKFLIFHRQVPVSFKNININAGLYKVSSTMPEHSLILGSLAIKPATVQYIAYGKRQRQSVIIKSVLINKEVFAMLDKFLHEFTITLHELKTPKIKKTKKVFNSIGLRIRQKLMDNPEFSELLYGKMYDTFKGIYLPLTVHFTIKKQSNFQLEETFFRMHRIPVTFYRVRQRPAFDDKTFMSAFELSWLYKELIFTTKNQVYSRM